MTPEALVPAAAEIGYAGVDIVDRETGSLPGIMGW